MLNVQKKKKKKEQKIVKNPRFEISQFFIQLW